MTNVCTLLPFESTVFVKDGICIMHSAEVQPVDTHRFIFILKPSHFLIFCTSMFLTASSRMASTTASTSNAYSFAKLKFNVNKNNGVYQLGKFSFHITHRWIIFCFFSLLVSRLL
uniref:Uncharacterized protein n=1 Tax=Ditylum brightwellii TaxID=49249 RepID=A0A7S1YPZ2_9STRA